MVRLDDATLGYAGKTVLRGISISLEPGERVVLLGPSGAGKSTLLNAIYAQLAGQDARVAFVPQHHGLVPQLSVRRNVYMGRLDDHTAAVNLSRLIFLPRQIRAEIEAILSQLGLAGLAERPVEALSGGQQQRTALARALYRGGRAILADEPVSAIDPVRSREALRLIAGRFDTALIALHDVTLAREFATRIVGLRDGGIMFDRPASRLDDRDIAALYG
ncbi:ATP-binding cassette domain-containing protein [Paracoccus sediminicola]|nr:ATP-binding cassette domain-containing protein [Paracoccus sediminicola]WBU58340.1 ATP-binding cassette domain-containing protein [Paracoccus sediminicola]